MHEISWSPSSVPVVHEETIVELYCPLPKKFVGKIQGMWRCVDPSCVCIFEYPRTILIMKCRHLNQAPCCKDAQHNAVHLAKKERSTATSHLAMALKNCFLLSSVMSQMTFQQHCFWSGHWSDNRCVVGAIWNSGWWRHCPWSGHCLHGSVLWLQNDWQQIFLRPVWLWWSHCWSCLSSCGCSGVQRNGQQNCGCFVPLLGKCALQLPSKSRLDWQHLVHRDPSSWCGSLYKLSQIKHPSKRRKSTIT